MPLFQIQHRVDTEANWAAVNPILLKGEIGLAIQADNSFAFKFGDGIKNWLALPYSSGAQGSEGPQGIEGPQGPEGPEGPQGDIGPEGPAGQTPPLSSAINSVDTNSAANSLAVKTAYDAAIVAQETAYQGASPSDEYIDMAQGNPWPIYAPDDGVWQITGNNGTSAYVWFSALVGGTSSPTSRLRFESVAREGENVSFFLPVNKGDRLFWGTSGINLLLNRFYYAKGAI